MNDEIMTAPLQMLQWHSHSSSHSPVRQSGSGGDKAGQIAYTARQRIKRPTTSCRFNTAGLKRCDLIADAHGVLTRGVKCVTDTLETGVRTLQAVGAAANENLAQLLLLGQQAQQAVRDLGVHVQAPVGDQAEALQLLVQLQTMRALQETGPRKTAVSCWARRVLPVALLNHDYESLATKHRRSTHTPAASSTGFTRFRQMAAVSSNSHHA